ncbi:MAG: hypothetical protein KA761_08425 [Gemmatimonadaceae bacterium]|nr:hypothetical protein [Gemmatimonadaceae bacterium]
MQRRSSILVLLALGTFLTACADAGSPLAPQMQPAGAIAAAKGADNTPSAPGAYDGFWVESPTSRFRLPNGTSQEVWVEFTLSSKNGVYGGTANRYVSYYDADGNPIALRTNLGTPGRVSATETAAGINVGITRLGESKLSIGYQFGASADKTVLTNLRLAGTATAIGFVKSVN